MRFSLKPCSVILGAFALSDGLREDRLRAPTISEETIEANLPELPPHLEDGFSLKQLEILHDYAAKAFEAGIEYAKKPHEGNRR